MGGCIDGWIGVSIGKVDVLCCYMIEVWSEDFGLFVVVGIVLVYIIGEVEDDVGVGWDVSYIYFSFWLIGLLFGVGNRNDWK